MIIESYHRFYEMTLPIVGVENLVMGITVTILCLAKKYGRLHNRSGFIFLAIAMLAMAAINFAEYAFGVRDETQNKSLAIVIFASSIEVFLCFFAYVSLLDKTFVTRKRIYGELVLIVLFTSPPLFVGQTDSALFWVLFSISLAFYVVKLTANFIVYRRCLRRAISQIEDYYSYSGSLLLAWINRTFYVIMAVGVLSIFAPMGNYAGLMVYNLLLFFAYFYIYIEIIRNMYIFDVSMETVYVQQVDELIEDELQLNIEAEFNAVQKEPSNTFMNERRKAICQEWIDRKGYTTPSITVDNVAMMLNTNRSRLSLYLNKELGMTYYEWIASLRIEDAKRLLIEEPETSIFSIAALIGIEDKSNFGRAFKRVTGMSPARYRNHYLENEK